MSQGNWTGGLFTTNGLKHSFYEIAAPALYRAHQEYWPLVQ
jgi:hypothetical protein